MKNRNVQHFLYGFSCLLLCWLGVLMVCTVAVAETIRAQAGRVAYEQNDFITAFKHFHQQVRQQPGDPEIDFLLGRCAYEIGDFETAIFAYERVLIAYPESDRTHLELARTYYSLGDMESARSEFKLVQSHQPPAAVQKNINHYLELINRAARMHSFSGSLTIGLSADNNVYSAPVNEQIQTILGRVLLNGNSATAQKDMISQNSLQLTHLYRSHPRNVGWKSSLIGYNSIYTEEQDLNLNLIGVNTGPVWQKQDQQTSVQVNINTLLLDADRYLSQLGLLMEHSRAFSTTTSLGIAGQLSRLDYAVDERDAAQYRVDLKYLSRFGKNQANITLGLELNEASENKYTYLRKQLSINVQRRFPWKLTGMLGVRMQVTDYDEPEPLFTEKRRDRLRELSVGLSRPLWKAEKGPEILLAQISYVIIDTLSNIDLYRYEKRVATFALSYRF